MPANSLSFKKNSWKYPLEFIDLFDILLLTRLLNLIVCPIPTNNSTSRYLYKLVNQKPMRTHG